MDFSKLHLEINQQLLLIILLCAFGVFFLIQVLYYLIVFRRLAFYKEKNQSTFQPPVSVIICARNEFENLKKYLELILTQEYPKFQVIVVNDCSWDESEEYLEALQTQYPILKVVTIKEQERYKHGKKFALAIGIKAAQYDHLLLTDADCRPACPDWITQMMQNYSTPETDFVIGYGSYKKQEGLLNKWIRFDTAFNAMQYLSYSLGGNTYMGVGRNLSYKKEVFFRNKGFASHQHILSGDDDLFVNENATSKNVRVCINTKGFTYSRPKQKWNDWYLQKKRHLSTSQYYKAGVKFKLALFYFSHYMLWLTAIPLLIMLFFWQWIAGALLIYLTTKMIIVSKVFRKLDERDIIWLIPVFNLYTLLIYPFINMTARLYRDETWR